MSEAFTRILGLNHLLTGQKVKSRRDPRDTRFLFWAILASLALVAVLFVYIWCRLSVVGMGYEISVANMERNALVEQNRRLKIEFMRLSSPRRIESIAVKELGLVHPVEGQIIRVGS
ncbi:MAG: hypothetical protein ACE5EZ_00725 [Thermodesulfobacteriota bacterium]